jgi:hypothetical protein
VWARGSGGAGIDGDDAGGGLRAIIQAGEEKILSSFFDAFLDDGYNNIYIQSRNYMIIF